MQIFISWHGKKSLAVAEALRDWLPQIVNAFEPFLSSTDIDKGTRWRTEISTKLATTKVGIICLTPSNLTAPWLLFEAGAISKPEKTYVCTFLIDLQPSDVTDPLAQFQATRATKEQVLQLVKNLNKAQDEAPRSEALVDKAFEKWWPDLEKHLRNLPQDEETQKPQRSDRNLLEELVEKVREVSNTLQLILPVAPLSGYSTHKSVYYALQGTGPQGPGPQGPGPQETRSAIYGEVPSANRQLFGVNGPSAGVPEVPSRPAAVPTGPQGPNETQSSRKATPPAQPRKH